MGSQAVEEKVLSYLQLNSEIPNSEIWAQQEGVDHAELADVIKSLHGFGFIEVQDIEKKTWVLTAEGADYAKNGSPEHQVFAAVPAEGISREDLQKLVGAGVFKIGFMKAMGNKWLEAKPKVSRKVTEVKDSVKQQLVALKNGDEKAVASADVADLKKRKLIALKTSKCYALQKGPNYAPIRRKFATDLTRDLISSNKWQDLVFKQYNLNALGQPTDGGHLHPLLKVRTQFRQIFLEMGFEEMPTNNFVESRQYIYGFSSLYEPAKASTFPEEYLQRVKTVHESGGYGSTGYGYDWKRDEAEKNLLRTHTTAVSSRMLYKLAQDGFVPKRYFSIDRVFRNEAVDRTHLAEFHQVEGLVCDRGLTLGDLIGVLNEFFARLGITKLRFKPAYNPYTEPSMEIFSYHEGLKKWVEVGNSGMFRPEMLLPMGLPEDVSVIAWGLSLERPTMILYHIDNIRDLFGHKVDMKLIKSNPVCLLGMQ